MRSGTQSQWRLMRAGVMCSDRRILKISRAAAFWTDCTGPVHRLIYCLKWYQSNSFHNAFESVASSLSLAGALRRPAGTPNRSAGTPYRLVTAHFHHCSYVWIFIHLYSLFGNSHSLADRTSRFIGHFIINLNKNKHRIVGLGPIYRKQQS